MSDTLTIPITLSGEFISLLGTQPQATATVKEYVILGLFQEDRISGGKAAELLGLTRLGFISLLTRKGISYFRLSLDEWAQEVATIHQWQTEHGQHGLISNA